ncbi:MAG TPA: CHAT domain-containing protein, partial [Candidatus Deferrimicrobium sp.]|nr:CHAT domain-containing protein [Candidatus Deferrimicrobium sp.]
TIENPYEINIPLLQQKLKPGQVIIKYTLLKNTVYAFFYEKNTMGYRKLNITASELVNWVNRLTEPLDDFTRGNVDYLHLYYDLPLARQLYVVLLKDILEIRQNGQAIRELFIIPDRELFKLPFEALVTGFKGQDLDPKTIFSEYASANYVIRDYTVSYFLSLFDIQKRAPLPAKNKKKYIITAFGSPGTHGFFREIPAAQKEILGISSIFGKVESRIFLADLFNKKNFEIFAPRSRIIHLATHFVNNLDNPEYSALVFSALKGNTPLDYSDYYDYYDFYYAQDIFKLKLDADLVVLSACESAEKHLEGLQGLKGMTAAFRKAGTRAMIVSMWPVDEYNSQLIPFFYRQYQRGISNAAALRTAKLQFMKETTVIVNGLKISFAHPFLWANYILYNFSLL